MVQKLRVRKVIKVVNPEHSFSLEDSLFAQLHGTALDIDFIVFIFLQLLDKAVSLKVHVGCLLLSAGNDQRRAGFIDQNRVNFVHKGKVQAAKDSVLHTCDHVVTQIVKSEFGVGCICDVAVISCTLAWL